MWIKHGGVSFAFSKQTQNQSQKCRDLFYTFLLFPFPFPLLFFFFLARALLNFGFWWCGGLNLGLWSLRHECLHSHYAIYSHCFFFSLTDFHIVNKECSNLYLYFLLFFFHISREHYEFQWTSRKFHFHQWNKLPVLTVLLPNYLQKSLFTVFGASPYQF